jgi:ATP-dependent Lon protease
VSELREMGLFPLDMVLLPGEVAPLHIFEPRYRQLVADCVLEDRPFAMVRASEEARAPVGCSARFESLDRRFEDGRMNVVVRGVDPVEIGEETSGHLYLSALVTALEDDPEMEHQELIAEATAVYREFAKSAIGEVREPPSIEGVPLSYAMAGSVDLAPEPKQRLLEQRRESSRLKEVTGILRTAGESIARSRMASERAPGNGKVSSR